MSPRSARASQTEPVSKQNKDKETTAEARSDQQTAREVSFLSFVLGIENPGLPVWSTQGIHHGLPNQPDSFFFF